MVQQDNKLKQLLSVVIENYIDQGSPVWSKYLNSLEEIEYAPSTLRKYLNLLEQEGLVYQPYNSSGRIPTVEGFESYLDDYLGEDTKQTTSLAQFDFDTDLARSSLRYMVEKLGDMVDGVVAGFLSNDEYYFLGINKLLKHMPDDFEGTSYIVEFIEKRGIIEFLGEKMIKRWQVYYSFIEHDDIVISCLYGKVMINNFDAILTVLWPTRVNYKTNLDVLTRIVKQYG